MPGRPPKPAHLRQRTNRKAGAIRQLTEPENPNIPAIPNPDGRTWHPLTVEQWEHAWSSPMASQWLATDVDGLGRLALLWDEFSKNTVRAGEAIKEIRLQQAAFGLSPLDRSRLQWEVARGEEAERKMPREPGKKTGTGDPRAFLSKAS